MKLYYSKGACSLAVRIIIHEIGIACEFESVNLKTKKTETGSDFLKINPKGAVPTLVLDSQEILTENAVIQQYLADTHQTDLLPPIKDFKRFRVLEWLNFISTDLHKTFGPLFNPTLPDDIKEIFKANVKNKLDIVDRHLSQNRYLLGDQFTLPDAYLFVIIAWLSIFKIELSSWSNLSRYNQDLRKRSSVQQSLKEEGF